MANNGSRTGITPVETVEKYEITTAHVAEYLQKRLNTFTTAARNNGVSIEDIPVNVVSIEFTKKFVPFAVILPEEAIAQRSGGDKDGISAIFQSEDNNDLQKLEKPVWSAIMAYLYTKQDKKAFTDSGNLKKTLGLTTGIANKIAGLCSPRIIKTDKEHRHVVCLIDPIRLFSDMIKNQGETNKEGAPKYFTIIDKTVRLSHENYKYMVTKDPKKHNNEAVGPDILKIVRESMSASKK